MMKILFVFDKFKGTLTAGDLCLLAEEVAEQHHRIDKYEAIPLSDGGEGFRECLTNVEGGSSQIITVAGPTFERVEASLGKVEKGKLPSVMKEVFADWQGDHIAVIEMAEASGLVLLPEKKRHPIRTTTKGTGELILEAARQRCSGIVMGVGGSATNDMGLGALQALGLKAFGENGEEIDDLTPGNWASIQRFDASEMIPLPPMIIACDVTNPLCGENGATATYGPQKGLLRQEIMPLDREMARIGELLCAAFGKNTDLMETPGAGAAGGIAFGFDVAYGARRVPGFDLVARWTNLEAVIEASDLIITGEGKFDKSSLSGKGPSGVIELALKKRKKIVVVVGQVDGGAKEHLETRKVAIYTLLDHARNSEEAMMHPATYFRKALSLAMDEMSST